MPRIMRLSDAPWTSGSDVVQSMAPAWREHLGPPEEVAHAYERYRQRSLCNDKSTTRRFDVIHLLPGYSDATAAYHDTVEESMIIDGVSVIDGEGNFSGGDYFWRPPGWVHKASTVTGFTAIISLEGLCSAEASGRASRVIRPSEECGTNALAAADQAPGPRGRVVKRSLADLPTGIGTTRAVFPFLVDSASGSDLRILSSNPVSGSCTAVLDVASGSSCAGAALPLHDVQLYVIAGSGALGATSIGAEDYVEIRADEPAALLAANEPLRLFIKCNLSLQALAQE